MSQDLPAAAPVIRYTTTHAARVVILVGCFIALLGDFLPWADSQAFSVDVTKAGINNSTLLIVSFAVSTLAITAFAFRNRLTRPGAIFVGAVAFLQVLVVGTLRINLTDPGLGLYLLPAGATLVLVGVLMVLAYPSRPVE